jgi:outer membrane murein-binding lipoprotein Lpp
MRTTKATDDDVIARLAGKGEQAVQRLSELPGGSRALRAFNDLKNRVDELSRKVRGIDALEQRVAKLEKDVAALKRAQKPATSQKAPVRKADV